VGGEKKERSGAKKENEGGSRQAFNLFGGGLTIQNKKATLVLRELKKRESQGQKEKGLKKTDEHRKKRDSPTGRGGSESAVESHTAGGIKGARPGAEKSGVGKKNRGLARRKTAPKIATAPADA